MTYLTRITIVSFLLLAMLCQLATPCGCAQCVFDRIGCNSPQHKETCQPSSCCHSHAEDKCHQSVLTGDRHDEQPQYPPHRNSTPCKRQLAYFMERHVVEGQHFHAMAAAASHDHRSLAAIVPDSNGAAAFPAQATLSEFISSTSAPRLQV